MAGKTGNQKLIEQFLTDGITYMFGNPGTVEQGFLDALRDYPDMRYILTLQESVAIMMADGYARATKKPALAQIHSSPGLGNAIGALYQAKRGHSPIVVIGGDAGVSYINMEAQMYGDLVGMARPVTKWSVMVQDERSLLRIIRRAIKVATTPPMGPVYVCLPADILDRLNEEPVFPSCMITPPAAPDTKDLSSIAHLLLNAKEPVFFVGDGVAYSNAQHELETLAELLGVPVWGVDSGELNMDTTHLAYQGQTGHMFGYSSLPVTKSGDVVFICGTYMLPEVYPELCEVYRPDALVIHIDADPDAIAQNHRVDKGVVADPKATLYALSEMIEQIATPEQRERMDYRRNALAEKKATEVKANRKLRFEGRSPVLLAFMEELAKQAGDAIIFDEALTSSDILNAYLPPVTPNRFFQTRGGSLGVGIPGAMAVKLAFPNETVIAFTGDGGSMYTIQAIWTAAHCNISAKFIVLNNRSYGLLKNNIEHYWKTQGTTAHEYPESFSLDNPDIDFVSLAKGQGIDAVQVTGVQDVKAAISAMLASEKPFLIDLVL